MAQTVQTGYEINPEFGFAGDIARPGEPHAYDSGLLHVPASSTRNPRPGDALIYDATHNEWRVPATAAESLAALGIMTYRVDRIQNATSNMLDFADESEIEIGVHGTFWVVAGEAVEYGDRLVWDVADYKWNVAAAPAAVDVPDSTANTVTANAVVAANLVAQINAVVAALGRLPVVCVSRAPAADGDLIEARIGYGRNF